MTAVMLLIVYLLVKVNKGHTIPQEQLRNAQGAVIDSPVLHSKSFETARQTDRQTESYTAIQTDSDTDTITTKNF